MEIPNEQPSQIELEELTTIERRAKIASFIARDMDIAGQVLSEEASKESQSRAFAEFEARSYQIEAWDAVWQARESGEKSALVHLATGLGKTSIAVVDYAKFCKEQDLEDSVRPRALFAVHQDSILEQADERFKQMIPGISTEFFKTRQPELPDANITFATLQSFRNELHRFPRDYFDYIIYDEAHHTKAKTFERVVEHFEPKFQLALTATPQRLDEKDISDLFGEPVYSKTLAEGMAEGYLADVEYSILADEAIHDAIAKGFEARSMSDIQRLLDLDLRNEEIVARIGEKKKEICEQEGVQEVKTLIFTDGIDYADTIANFMDTTSYHSGMPKPKQRMILEQFRDGTINDLVVKDKFNEGVDIQDIRLVVFLRSTQSRAIFEQQLGRGLRRSMDKSKVYVMDFVANIERIEFVKDLADQYSFNAFGGGGSSKKSTANKEGQEAVNQPHPQYRTTFEFSEEIIDILEKMTSLTQSPPENWLNYTQAAELLNVSDDAVRNRLTIMQREGEWYRSSSGSPGRYISPETFEALRDYAPGIPETYVSIGEVADLLGITSTTVKSRLKQLEIEYATFVHEKGYSIGAITSEQFEALRGYADIPDGYRSIVDISKESGHTWNHIKKRSVQLDIPVEYFIHPTSGQKTGFVSAENAEKIGNTEIYNKLILLRKHEIDGAEDLPISLSEDVISIEELARELQVSKNTLLKNFLEKLNMTYSRIILADLSVHEVVTLEDAEQVRKLSIRADENHIALTKAALKLNIDYVKLKTFIESNDIQTETLMSKNLRLATYISVDTLQELKLFFTEDEKNNQIGDYVTFEQIASRFNVDYQTVAAWVKKLGITPISRQIHRVGRPTNLLDTADVTHIEQRIAPEGYLKFEQAASQLGVGRNTLINQVERLGLQPRRFMGAQGPDALYISPEDFELIKNEYTIPENWMSLLELSKSMKMAANKLAAIAKANDVPVKMVQPIGKGRPVPYIPEEHLGIFQ